MTFLTRTVLAFVAAAPLMLGAAHAQEISESHMAASRTVIKAIRATDNFDDILPQGADALKTEMIQKNPDLEAIIIEIVDAEALKLASRRADLEKEAAVAYAKIFTEQELNDIAAFYQSASGQRLLTEGPIATREVYKAADIWQNGIARDLAENVGKVMQARAPAAPADAPKEGEAPKAN